MPPFQKCKIVKIVQDFGFNFTKNTPSPQMKTCEKFSGLVCENNRCVPHGYLVLTVSLLIHQKKYISFSFHDNPTAPKSVSVMIIPLRNLLHFKHVRKIPLYLFVCNDYKTSTL